MKKIAKSKSKEFRTIKRKAINCMLNLKGTVCLLTVGLIKKT